MPNKIYFLPAFAESPVRKGGDECEKGIRSNLGEGGSASTGSSEDVKMPRVETRGASLVGLKTPPFGALKISLVLTLGYAIVAILVRFNSKLFEF